MQPCILETIINVKGFNMANKTFFEKLLAWGSLIGAALFAGFCIYFFIMVLLDK